MDPAIGEDTFEIEDKVESVVYSAVAPPRLFEFQDDFFTLLEKVQATTNFIPADVDVRNDYGILRSLRRGVTSHARNMGVDESLLHLFNRWRTAMKNSSGIENLDMADTYSKLETLIPALLGFSRPL